MKNNFSAYIAESIGTFVLVLFGCGVAVVSGGNLVATALAFGLVIVAMAYSIGNISGCHINPAVSLSMALMKKMPWKDFSLYVLFQVIGGLLGSLVLMLILGGNNNLGANAINPLVITAGGFGALLIGLVVEIILTFVFILAILGVTDKVDNKIIVGLVIGLTLTLVHLLGINLTGTSVNPARSLAPAILQGGVSLEQIWIFIIGPFLGAILATYTYKFLNRTQG
ncbi:MAG: MIP/aquaporin family protein [Candidatus Izemoplasmatales bacterium]